jgi:hypothetical protein
LKPLLKGVGFKSSNDGNVANSDRGVCLAVLVVNGRLVQSGPVMEGYVPVQYDTVVVMFGFGKTKLNSLSAYHMTFVVNAAIPGAQSGLLGFPLHIIGSAVPLQPLEEKVLEPGLIELEGCVTEGLAEIDENKLETVKLDVIEMLALVELLPELDDEVEVDVEFSDEVVFTNIGGVGIVGGTELVTIVDKDSVDVLHADNDGCVEVTVDEDGPDDGTAVELVRVISGVDKAVVVMPVDVKSKLERLGLLLNSVDDDRLAIDVDSVPVNDWLVLVPRLLGPLEDPCILDGGVGITEVVVRLPGDADIDVSEPPVLEIPTNGDVGFCEDSGTELIESDSWPELGGSEKEPVGDETSTDELDRATAEETPVAAAVEVGELPMLEIVVTPVEEGVGRDTVNRVLSVLEDEVTGAELGRLVGRNVAVDKDGKETVKLMGVVELTVLVWVDPVDTALVGPNTVVGTLDKGGMEGAPGVDWSGRLGAGLEGNTPGIDEVPDNPGGLIAEPGVPLGVAPELDVIGTLTEMICELWLVLGGNARLGGRLGPFAIVEVVVSLPDGPVRVFVTTTGGGWDGGGCPIVPDEVGMPNDGRPGLGIMLLVVGENNDGLLAPRGAPTLGVTVAVEPGMDVGIDEALGTWEVTNEDGKVEDKSGGEGAIAGNPLVIGKPGTMGGGPEVDGSPVGGVVVTPSVVVTSVLNRVGGAMLFSQWVVLLMTE